MINRREFSLGVTLGLGLGASARAQTPRYREGKNYRRIDRPAPTRAPAGKVEVVEFFGYFCPHCNSFEPMLGSWLKSAQAPSQMAFRRVPVNFNRRPQGKDIPDPDPLQKLYYALEGLGLLDTLHARAFRTIHVEHKPLSKDAQIIAWAQAQGLDAAKFQAMYNSFGVAAQANQATRLMQAYGVESVPSMGVDGRYYIDLESAGGMPQMLQVVTFLAQGAGQG